MAHYAFLNDNNVVTNVIVGKDEGEDNVDWEIFYGDFQQQVCKRTSINTRFGVYHIPGTDQPDPDQTKAFRKNYAEIGFIYYPAADAFSPPKPYPSWILNTETYRWEPPIPYPDSEQPYIWNESTQTWELINDQN